MINSDIFCSFWDILRRYAIDNGKQQKKNTHTKFLRLFVHAYNVGR